MRETVVEMSALDKLAVRLAYKTRSGRGGLRRQILRVLGVDIPPSVAIGPGLKLPHAGSGHVVHWRTRIGANVVLNPGVVIGRADLTGRREDAVEVEIGDDVIIGANAVIMATGGRPLTVGAGSIVGANSVLTKSTGQGEVWAGNPARLVRTLDY